jgi:type I restriction enzyme, S subunit
MSKIVKKRLGDIINFKRGYDLPSYNRIEGAYPIISSSGISGYHSEYKKEGEGLITGRYGTLGEVFYINGRYWPHNTALYVTDFKNNYPKYAYFLMKCLGNLKTSDKSTVPGINRNDLHELVVPYIKKEFQKPLADSLFNIEEKIELNNRINAELEAMAKTLYDYWFVQLDFPNEQGEPYKTSGGKMVWNEQLKREIPEGWKVGVIGDYCPSTGGFAFKSEWWSNEGISVVKIKDIQEDYTINLSDLSKVDLLDKKVDDKFKAKAGDILIAMTGATIGKYAIVPITNYPIYVNQRVGYFNLGNEPSENLPFLINSLNQKYFREAIFTLASGAAQPNISNEQINNIQLVLPEAYLVKKYNKKLKSSYQRILKNQFENQHLSSLRDWLLPMLMNGQVTVGAKEKAIYKAEEELRMAAETLGKYRKIIQFVQKKCEPTETAILGGHIINQTNNEDFGRVKFQKLLHLTSYNCKVDICANFMKNVAGPHDGQLIKEIESTLQRYHFYQIKQSGYDNHRVNYTPLNSVNELEEIYKTAFATESQRIDAFLIKFKNSTWEQCEIISTLYAVWNNRLIKNEVVTDELLKQDFLSWDKHKKKYKERLDGALQWMRDKEVIPDGWGKLIE